MEDLNQIIRMNKLIVEALKSNSDDESLRRMYELALATKEAARLTVCASSTEYDLLVDNIDELRKKLGITKEKPKALTPDSDGEPKEFEFKVRDQEFYVQDKKPDHGRGSR